MDITSIVVSGVVAIIASIITGSIVSSKVKRNDVQENFEDMFDDLYDNVTDAFKSEMSHTKELFAITQNEMNSNITEKIASMDSHINQKQDMMNSRVSESILRQEERIKTFSLENQQRLEHMRNMVEKSLYNIQMDNNKKLEEMRIVVDEKLQKSLNERMNQSFSMVSERLEQVYKGLGEMQNLANGVGDLKKVLSNVKTRGIVGEIQLGAILQEILSNEQYDENVAVVPNSS